jgi:hypothetical protein
MIGQAQRTPAVDTVVETPRVLAGLPVRRGWGV